MPTHTCTWTIARDGTPVAYRCGRRAEWLASFSDGIERGTQEVCDEHLLDAQDDPDYLGARAL